MERFNQINDFLANSSFFYTIAIGMDSRYSYVSNNYNNNFDHTNDSLLGKEFSITLHPEDIRICEEVGKRCFEQPERLFPATLRKHDGKGGFVFTQWEMQSFFDGNNQPVGIFCVGYNISEFVDTRSRLADATSEIAGKNDQLQEIGFMQSHIIRKPLANIMGLAYVLKTIEAESNQNIVEMIVASAKELDQAVKQISNKIV